MDQDLSVLQIAHHHPEDVYLELNLDHPEVLRDPVFQDAQKIDRVVESLGMRDGQQLREALDCLEQPTHGGDLLVLELFDEDAADLVVAEEGNNYLKFRREEVLVIQLSLISFAGTKLRGELLDFFCDVMPDDVFIYLFTQLGVLDLVDQVVGPRK